MNYASGRFKISLFSKYFCQRPDAFSSGVMCNKNRPWNEGLFADQLIGHLIPTGHC
jgi:hypothetical protein